MLQPTDRPPASLRAAIGGLHEPGPAAGHDREAEAADAPADLARDLVVRMRLAKARRSEDRDARADEVQRAKAANEVAHRAPEELDLPEPRMRTFEKDAVVGAGRGFVRRRRRRRRRLGRSDGMRRPARATSSQAPESATPCVVGRPRRTRRTRRPRHG